MKDGGRPDRDTVAQIGDAESPLMDNLSVAHDRNRAARRMIASPGLEQFINAFCFRHPFLRDHFPVAGKPRAGKFAMYGIEGCDDCFGPRGGKANGLPCADAAVRRGLV